MPKRSDHLPNYYDGSSHVEFSEEITESLDPKQTEEVINNEEWRRSVSANPYGAKSES